MLNSAAHITGGGLVDNLIRSVPDHLSLSLDLAKIKPKSIFGWIKSNNVTDHEMLKTFNCGVGFCLVVKKNNIKKITKVFPRAYTPYQIGFVSKNKKRLNIYNKVRW